MLHIWCNSTHCYIRTSCKWRIKHLAKNPVSIQSWLMINQQTNLFSLLLQHRVKIAWPTIWTWTIFNDTPKCSVSICSIWCHSSINNNSPAQAIVVKTTGNLKNCELIRRTQNQQKRKKTFFKWCILILQSSTLLLCVADNDINNNTSSILPSFC